MSWLTEWFVLWSFSFWLLLGAEAIFLIFCLWDDEDIKAALAIFSLLLVAATLQFLGKIPIFQTITANPKVMIYLLVGYVFLGAVWMCTKWILFVKSKVRKYEQGVRDEFIREFKIRSSDIPDNLKPLLRKKLEDRPSYGSNYVSLEPPQVSKYKDELFGWFALWPFSAVWTIINDPIRRAFEVIYHNLRESLQRISNQIWKRILEDTGANKE